MKKTADETSATILNDAGVSESRRSLAMGLLGAFGVGSLLKGCAPGQRPEENVGPYDPEPDATGLAAVVQGLSGTSLRWVDSVLGAAPPATISLCRSQVFTRTAHLPDHTHRVEQPFAPKLRARLGTLFMGIPSLGLRSGLALCALSTFGCDGGGRPAEQHQQGERPPVSSVTTARVTLGFATGVIRDEVEVQSFAIGTTPVTVAEYQACVDAEACPTLSCATADPELGARGKRPLDCAGPAAARAYCQWTKGALPDLAQWLLAARGVSPSRFAWGDAKASCERHPWASAHLAARSDVAEGRVGRGAVKCAHSDETLAVGSHPDGASAAGVQDVLLTAGELVRPHASSPFASCSPDERGACLVYGLEGGAIDAVSAVAQGELVSSGAGFRCVWEK